MTYFPDIRTNEEYNEKSLTGERKAFLKGFDFAVEVLDTMKNNLDSYIEDSIVIHYLAEHEEEAEKVFSSILHYIELERNMVGCSLLDEEYSLKEKEKKEEKHEEDVE